MRGDLGPAFDSATPSQPDPGSRRRHPSQTPGTVLANSAPGVPGDPPPRRASSAATNVRAGVVPLCPGRPARSAGDWVPAAVASDVVAARREPEAGMDSALQSRLTELAAELEVPGVAVGLLLDGEEHYAFHGVTSVENPLPVDETTLFQFGSTGRRTPPPRSCGWSSRGRSTSTHRCAPTCRSFRLKDEDVADRVTVLQLLNHTAGWEGDMIEDTGDGDDALEKYVARMGELEQVTPLGATVSYNNASLSVAGRILEKVTGSTYEQAIARSPARAARPGPHVLLPERGHDPPLRRRARPARRRPGHRRAAVGDAPQRQARRRHVGHGGRPGRLGALPPRRRHRAGRHPAAHRGLARAHAAAHGRRCPAARSATTSASAGCCATSATCGWSGTAGPRSASTPSS